MLEYSRGTGVSLSYTKALVLLAMVCCTGKIHANDGINVAVASNFLTTARQLVAEYKNKTGRNVSLSSGSTGKLYTQIIYGAPFDLYMAADTKHPLLLERKNLIVKASRKTYAVGKLVFWNKIKTDDCQLSLSNLKFKRLAIANPAIAPYGAAAKEVLVQNGLWGGLKMRMARGENIGQTLAYIRSGAADAGFVSESQVESLRGGCIWRIPADQYGQLDQQMVILSSSKRQNEARLFAAYIQSQKSRSIIYENGYD